MSIPARPDHDPDLVISDGLRAGMELIEEALRYYNADGSLEVMGSVEAVTEKRKWDAAHFRLQKVDCADCGSRMVRQGTEGYPSPWMCPNCVMRRLEAAERALGGYIPRTLQTPRQSL